MSKLLYFKAVFANGYHCIFTAKDIDAALEIAQKWWHEKPTYLISLEIIKNQKDESKD